MKTFVFFALMSLHVYGTEPKKPIEPLGSCDNAAKAAPTATDGSCTIGTGQTDAPGLGLKGWELYSWQEKGKWLYSLIPGTNAIVNFELVKGAAVDSLETLKLKLTAIGDSQEVFWNTRTVDGLKLALPSEKQRKKVTATLKHKFHLPKK